MEAVAKLKNCPYSPRKMRLMADLVRGKNVDEALNIMKFHTKKPYAIKLEKLILSAISNYKIVNEEDRVDENSLFIKTIMVDSGRQLKRMRPAPQGRGYRIRKRSNHVTLIVDTLNKIDIDNTETPVQEENISE